MHKVFLVDDEIVIREGIRNNFLRQETEFTLAGEAPDGEIALSMLQDIKPDILVTDIRMPFMDGLELCRQAMASMPWLHVIILSGYDDFSYAKQAMSLGVRDYLLKPVNAQDLLEALRRVAKTIEETKKQQADVRALRQQFATNSQYLKERLLQELLGGQVDEENMDAFHERARGLKLNLHANVYMVLLITPQYSGQRREEALAVQMQLRRLTAGSGGTVQFCECGGDPVLLALGDSDTDLEERAYGVAQAVQHELETSASIRANVSLGKIVRYPWQLPQSLAAAQRVQQSAEALDQGRRGMRTILSVDDVAMETGLSLAELDVLPITQQLQFVAYKDIEVVLDRYVASLGESAVHSTMMINYIYVEVVLAASQIIKQSGGNPAEVLPPEYRQDSAVSQLDSVEAIKPVLKSILQCAVAFRDGQPNGRYGAVIRDAQAYLSEHYQDTGISLRDVASHVALSNNHFCTVFSQETGITFTEYLTGLRLNKAKELIQTTTMRASEIAYKVGYNDPHYFSYLFKKHTGVTPREFRQASGRKGGDD